MARGGKREGSGRKPGLSKVMLLKRKIQEFFSDEEVSELVEEVKRQARKKPELMKFLLEQLFGKAPQRMELTGKDGKPLFLPSEILNKNGVNSGAKGNSR
jgi:hypothetical protein